MHLPAEQCRSALCLVEDQEQVDKLLEIREQCPQIARIIYDPRGLRNYNEEGLDALDSLIETGSAWASCEPRLVQGRGGQPSQTMWRPCSSHPAPQATLKGRGAPHSTLLDRRHRGRRVRQAHQQRRSAGLPAPAWIGQNIFSYAQWLACGYVVNCPGIGQHRHHRPQGSGPHLLLCAPRIFEGLLTSVMIRMEDAGTLKRKMFEACMRRGQTRAGPRPDGRRSRGHHRQDQYALGNLLVYGPLRNNLGFSRVRVAYPPARPLAPDLFTFYRSIGINLKPAVRLHRNRSVRVPAARQPGPRRHRGRAIRACRSRWLTTAKSW